MVKFMEDCQVLLRFCGYCSYDTDGNSSRYRWSGVVNQLLAFLHAYFILTSIAFLCDSRQPIDERILIIMSVVAFSEQAGGHISFTANKSNINELFKYFGMIVNQRATASPAVIDFYSEAERKTTSIRKITTSYILIPYNAFILVPFAYTVIQKIIIEQCASEPITWTVILRASWPFDRNTVHGYLYYTFTTYVCIYHYFGLLMVYAQFFLGICFYLIAFCQDFSHSIRSWDKLRDEFVQTREARRDRYEYEQELNKEIYKAIDFQADIIQYYSRINDILNGVMFSNLTGGAIFCAVSVQQVQSSSGHIDLLFLSNVASVIISLIVTFPYCYAATIAFDKIQSLNGSIFNTFWYKLPVKCQRHIVMMLMPAKYIRELSGYDLIVCSLETFRQMIKMSGSLYIMITSI